MELDDPVWMVADGCIMDFQENLHSSTLQACMALTVALGEVSTSCRCCLGSCPL